MSNEHDAAIGRFIRGSMEYIEQGWCEIVTVVYRARHCKVEAKIQRDYSSNGRTVLIEEEEEEQH